MTQLAKCDVLRMPEQIPKDHFMPAQTNNGQERQADLQTSNSNQIQWGEVEGEGQFNALTALKMVHEILELQDQCIDQLKERIESLEARIKEMESDGK